MRTLGLIGKVPVSVSVKNSNNGQIIKPIFKAWIAALGIGWIFLFEAYRLVGVGVSTLAYYCGPVIVMALSPLLFSERLTHVKVAGFSCVVLGAFFVVAQGGGHGASAQGLALGGMSAVMYAAMAVFSRRAPQIRGLEAASE